MSETAIITTAKPPEEIELQKKLSTLERLSDRLADKEELMTDMRSVLEQFEARYSMQVGRLYADLDEIEAEIAEEEYKLVPDDEDIKRKAEELRRRAEESAARVEEAAERASQRSEPSAETKKAYHKLARTIHPDLALDPDEKEKRHNLMAELNRAYSSGDQGRLDELMAAAANSPDRITGDSIGDRLVRTIRQIYQVRERLKNLRAEEVVVRASELYALREKMLSEMADGRDMIDQMAARTAVQIKRSRRRLENLRSVNKAAEQHVLDEYGMDISAFR